MKWGLGQSPKQVDNQSVFGLNETGMNRILGIQKNRGLECFRFPLIVILAL
jgi:hypothetical protein